jgi:phosphate transporter
MLIILRISSSFPSFTLPSHSLPYPLLVWRQMVTSQRSNEIPGGVIRALPNDRSNGLPTPDSKDPYYPILRTPLGTLYFPRWLSKGGAIFAMASVLLVLMCTGVIRTFARVEERNCLAMLVFCSVLWATEVSLERFCGDGKGG